jgi:hypothetical protein
MPRGGKRNGAGAKPRLSGLERIYCWEHCERLWRESERRAEQTYWDNIIVRGGDLRALREKQNKLNGLEIYQRAIVLRGKGEEEGPQTLSDVRIEIDDLGKVAARISSGRSGSRYHRIPRSYRQWTGIFATVAVSASAKFGRRITFDDVLGNWKRRKSKLRA